MMRAATDELMKNQVQVCNGEDCVGCVDLRDDMHFHVSSTAMVVDMYSKVIITALRTASVSDNFLSGNNVHEAPQLVDEISTCHASPMDLDHNQVPAISLLQNEFHSEIDYLHHVMHLCADSDFSDKCSSVRCPAILNGAPWLRIRLEDAYEIGPRLDEKTQKGLHLNALDSETGGPSTFYHGTHGLYALNILSQRHLKHGTIITGSKCGLWHGPPRKAVEYAWPSLWPTCERATMCMFELRVVQHTKHALHVHVCRNQGTYEVVAVLMQRWRGSTHDLDLHRDFHFMRNGDADLAMMWREGAPLLPPPISEELPPAVELQSSDSEGEFEEEVYFEDHECTPALEQEIKEFILEANALATSRGKKATVFKRYPHRMPRVFQPGDDRFLKKTDRIYACDQCGLLVTYSSYTRGTGFRSECDFHGAYRDKS